MQLPLDTRIARHKTVGTWNELKKSLVDFKNIVAWTSAYEDYFLARLQDRYTEPIQAIQISGNKKGEGFSMMAIICSLIEFLESTYQGRNYRYIEKGDKSLNLLSEYIKSSEIFISFLTQHKPFDSYFDKTKAKDFYKNVRCGLLHEARTIDKWIIKVLPSTKDLIEYNATEKIIYRDNFFEAVNLFITEYKNDLLNSSDRKEAFIKKYDNLCNE